LFCLALSLALTNQHRSPRRVESLYDDLNRLKQFEPAGYTANLDAWRHALLAASKAGVIPSQATNFSKSQFVISTGDQLLKALDTRQYGIPQSLELVLVSIIRTRALYAYSNR